MLQTAMGPDSTILNVAQYQPMGEEMEVERAQARQNAVGLIPNESRTILLTMNAVLTFCLTLEPVKLQFSMT